MTDRQTLPLRVLFLATYFPKPTNELMGTWALKQAQSLLRFGLDVRVVSFTSWVPGVLARTRGARAYAACPRAHRWGDLAVEYPRWPVYQVGRLKRWAHRDPRSQMWIGWWWARPVLDRLAREFRPDVVFAHHTAVNGFLAERFKARHGVPFVVTDHDFDEIADCAKYPGRQAVFTRVAAAASRMVAVSSRMEALLKERCPIARTMTLLNGTDPLPASLWEVPRSEELRGKVVIFSLAALYERKGIPLLVRAFAGVAARRPEAVLRIAGDGPERGAVETAVRETGLGDRVQLLGSLPHAQAMQEMVWSDVFALAGWDEPLGAVYLEAASAGKPSVWCADGGINDVFVSGEHGLAVPPKNLSALSEVLEQLVSDGDARERMGAAARRLFEAKLGWEVNARAMDALFRQAHAGCHLP